MLLLVPSRFSKRSRRSLRSLKFPPLWSSRSSKLAFILSRMLPRGWAFLTSIYPHKSKSTPVQHPLGPDKDLRTGFPRISNVLQFSAFSTAPSLSKVTNPNPLGLPVSLSIIKVASITRPNCVKNSLKSVSEASWLTPPTKILDVFSCSSRGIARFGSI